MKMQIVFAHGAGAPSSSPWMSDWAGRLDALGEVTAFDYPYMRAGQKAPDRLPKLIAAHRDVLSAVRAHEKRRPVVLAGKSMGGRVGCHVALEQNVDALVCFGYPLASRGKLRDEVLVALRTPILFVQGDRDSLCPIDKLQEVRKRMTATSSLHIVEGGNHSLLVGKRRLKEAGLTQEDVDRESLSAVAAFLGSLE